MEMPPSPEPITQPSTTLVVQTAIFRSELAFVSAVTRPADVKLYLFVLVESDGGALRLTATDGLATFCTRVPVTGGEGATFAVVVHRRHLVSLVELLEEA